MSSDYWIEFKKTGKNSFNAATGDLTLFNGSKIVLKSRAFSGGFPAPGLVPIPEYDHYTIRLDIRGTVSYSSVQNAPDNPTVQELKPFYGIQKIPPAISTPNGDSLNARYEWGSIRAALNEKHGELRQAYRGNYLHGKQRDGDYTHGCICERTEQIISYLFTLEWRKQSHIPVVVK